MRAYHVRGAHLSTSPQTKFMIKRIVILSVIYALLMVAVTLTMSKAGDTYIVILLVLGLIFSFLLIREIFKKYIVGFKSKNNQLDYISVNHQGLHKISKKPFLFGLEKKIIDDHEFYFDDNYLYAVNSDHKAAQFSLKDITELSKTSIQINNGRIWQMKINNNNNEVVFKFANNYTIWNKNFLTFYDKVKNINPSVIKSKWNIWTL